MCLVKGNDSKEGYKCPQDARRHYIPTAIFVSRIAQITASSVFKSEIDVGECTDKSTQTHLSRVSYCDLDLDTGLDRDRRDLLDDVRGRVQVNDTLVDSHLKAVPRVRTLTTWRLARGKT